MKFDDYNGDADEVKKFWNDSSDPAPSDWENNQTSDSTSLPDKQTKRKIPQPIADSLSKLGADLISKFGPDLISKLASNMMSKSNSNSGFDFDSGFNSDLFNRNKSMSDDIFDRVNRQISDMNKKFKK